MDQTGQRQRVNLSAHAAQVIESDMAAFGREDTPAGFICRVMGAFAQDSDASVSNSAKRRSDELGRQLQEARYRVSYPRDAGLVHFDRKADPLSEKELRIIDEIARQRAGDAFARISCQPKEHPFNIRLRNDVYGTLYPDTGEWVESEHFNGKRGEYIKAVIEDYASRPFYERESIVMRDVLDDLELALDPPPSGRNIVTVALGPAGGARCFDVKPYAVMRDTGWNYNYFVGMSREAGTSDRFIPASFRISRIGEVKLRPRSHGSGKITQAERAELQEALRERGVQYLLNGQAHIRVALTGEGWGLYGRILHGRPQYTAKSEAGGMVELEFDCTDLQARNYFVQFGADARVLEPESLAEDFAAHHAAAAEAYGALQ